MWFEKIGHFFSVCEDPVISLPIWQLENAALGGLRQRALEPGQGLVNCGRERYQVTFKELCGQITFMQCLWVHLRYPFGNGDGKGRILEGDLFLLVGCRAWKIRVIRLRNIEKHEITYEKKHFPSLFPPLSAAKDVVLEFLLFKTVLDFHWFSNM